MATIKTNTKNTYYAVLTLTEGSYNIEANTSPVRYNLTLYNGIQNFEGYTIGYKIIINGVQVAYHDNSGNQTSMAANSSKTVATGSTTIAHNTDGSKTISASVEIWTNNMSYLPVSLSGSGSMTLATIPRASTPTLSASSFNAGSGLTIYTNRASSSFTHTLTYSLNGSSGTIATGVGASYTWSNTKALASLIPNATSGTVTIYCYTYNGSTHIGTKSVTVTISVPNTADFMPAISSVSVVDEKNLATKYSGYVQGKSVPKLTISATSTYSTIKNYKVEFQGGAITATTNVVSLAAISQTGSLDIVVTVTDGRGRTASKTETIEALAYNSPTVSARVVRCNSDGTDNDEGAYMKVSCSAEVVALNDVNSKDIALQYRQKGAANWTTEKEWETYIVNEDVVIAADIDHSYEIQLVATDDFATSTFGAELGTVAVTIDYHESGKGIAIGKVSEGEGFEVDWESKFNKDVEVDGNSTFNGDVTIKGKILPAEHMYSGALLAYGMLTPTGSSGAKSTTFGFSDIGTDRVYEINNFVSGILTGQAGAILVETKGIVGMVEVEVSVSGYLGTGMTGIWFQPNRNTLPTGVTELGTTYKSIISVLGNSYGGASYKYIFKVDTGENVSFFVNPGIMPYNGSMEPNASGIRCQMSVKVYGKM